MKKYLKNFILAALFIIAGLFFKLCLLGYSFMAYTMFFCAVISLYFALVKFLQKKYPRGGKLFYRITLTCLLLFLMVFVVTEAMIIGEQKKGTSDAEYAIVLGAGVNGNTPSRSLKARLDAALKYYEGNKEVILVVSGGRGPGENVTEAQCMADWLTLRGVPKEQIVLEDRARNTEENITFSKELIFMREPGFDGKVCIISEGYHILRARMAAERAGVQNVTVAVGHTGFPILTVNYYIREFFAVLYYAVKR